MVRLAISRLSAAYDLAIDDRKLTVNPCRRVELPLLPKSRPVPWSREEAGRFLAEAAKDRLHVAWLLCLYGPRRAEICGLRWQDVDLDARTLKISQVRNVTDGKIELKDHPKSDRAARTLPLDDTLVAAFRAMRKRQAAEILAAGPAYADSGYVVTDELGAPVNPEWLTDEFPRVAKRAGVPRKTPHGGRHTANSLMASMGVPDHIRAAWCGHSVEVNRAVYTNARPEDLLTARDTLSRLYGG